MTKKTFCFFSYVFVSHDKKPFVFFSKKEKYIKSINTDYKGYNILNSEYHNLLADKTNRCKEIEKKKII